MKVGDLVEIGKKGEEELVVGVVVDICLPEDHVNGMHIIQALHEGKTTWWPVGFVRKINESR
tara:strand:- start:91 stop:276 length:186 start_codon:yes stop_codon:yes gene_type:complete